MAEILKENNIDVTFEHGPGEHDWIFWDQWIQRALAWLFNKRRLTTYGRNKVLQRLDGYPNTSDLSL